MSVIFPSGRQIFDSSQIEINITTDGNITSQYAGVYYFSIQGRNRIGKNYQYITNAITIPINGNVEIKVKNLKWAEEWIYITIGLSTSNNPITFQQIMNIPGKFAGTYGDLLGVNYKSAVPPRNFISDDNYSFIAPYLQGLSTWDELELKYAGKNINIDEDKFGLNTVYEIKSNIKFDQQLKLKNKIADNTLFPLLSNYNSEYQLLNGNLIELESTNLIYELDVFDNNSTIDNIYCFSTSNPSIGRWKAISRWETHVSLITDDYGAYQNLNDKKDLNYDGQFIIPNYFYNVDYSIPVILWIYNDTNSIVNKNTIIRHNVYLGESLRTELFSGKIGIKVLGIINLETFDLRIREKDTDNLFFNLNKSYLLNTYNDGIYCPDNIESNEALILQYEILLENNEFKGLITDETFVKIIPSFSRDYGSYIPGIGALLGEGIIFTDENGYNKRIVPSDNNTCIALPGSGIVQGYGFPQTESQLINDLALDTEDQIIYITGNGFCFNRLSTDKPPQSLGYAVRSVISTKSGKSDIWMFAGLSSAYLDGIKITNTTGFNIEIYHQTMHSQKLAERIAQIRGNYPDVIAGYPCQFNCTTFDIIIRQDVFNDYDIINDKFLDYSHSIYYEYKNISIDLSNIDQYLNINDKNAATNTYTAINNLVPIEYNTQFGIYSPPKGTVKNLISGNFTQGIYKVSCRYNYSGNYISEISHERNICIREYNGSLNDLLTKSYLSQYYSFPVENTNQLRNYATSNLAKGRLVLVNNLNKLYKYDTSNIVLQDDDLNVIKHNYIINGYFFLINNNINKIENNILNIGNKFKVVIWNNGIKVLSGQYQLSNGYASNFIQDTILTYNDLLLIGLPSTWINPVYLIIYNNQYKIITLRSELNNFENAIIICKLFTTENNYSYIGNESNTYYINKNTSNISLNLNYGKINKINDNYIEKRIRKLTCKLNADLLDLYLIEVEPSYTFILNNLKFENNVYIKNEKEYLAYLCIKYYKTQLATLLNINSNVFVLNNINLASNYFITLNTSLDNINKPLFIYDVSKNSWFNYIESINYLINIFNISNVVKSYINANNLIQFPLKKYYWRYQYAIEYDNSGDSSVTAAKILNGNTNLTTNEFSSYVEFDTTDKLPKIYNRENLINVPEQEITINNNVTNSLFPYTGYFNIAYGYTYFANNNKIIKISQNTLQENCFPSLSSLQNDNIVEVVSKFEDILDLNENDYSIHLPNDITLNSNLDNSSIQLQRYNNLINFNITNDLPNLEIHSNNRHLEIKDSLLKIYDNTKTILETLPNGYLKTKGILVNDKKILGVQLPDITSPTEDLTEIHQCLLNILNVLRTHGLINNSASLINNLILLNNSNYLGN